MSNLHRSPTSLRSLLAAAGRRLEGSLGHELKILLQRRDITLPHDRELVGQIHAIKRRVLPSGNVSFDAERNARGHADKIWAVALACQKERNAVVARPGGIGVG